MAAGDPMPLDENPLFPDRVPQYYCGNPSTSLANQIAAELRQPIEQSLAHRTPNSTRIVRPGSSETRAVCGDCAPGGRKKRRYRSSGGRTARIPIRPSEAPRVRARRAPVWDVQVVRELGRGAFGIVFLAFDLATGPRGRAQTPRPEAIVTPGFCERFLRRRRRRPRLSHPNVVSVFESGEWGPICYIAQEYCPGRRWRHGSSSGPNPSLWRRPPGWWPLSPGRSITRTSIGIIHRDLKPSNVMLVPKSVGG